MLAVPVLRGMFAFLLAGRRRSGPEGLPVTPETQPKLWAEVREASRKACTVEPDALFLTGDVNAAVTERARLLGLLPGPRSLYLGVPLLTGLTTPELHAVLAHEFGHFSNQDTRLAGVTMRSRAAVLHTVDAFRAHDSRAHAVIGNLYVHYARFFLRATQSSAPLTTTTSTRTPPWASPRTRFHPSANSTAASDTFWPRGVPRS
ncbi:M48 family metallopeptidase [Streptomyces sp. NPDC004532]